MISYLDRISAVTVLHQKTAVAEYSLGEFDCFLAGMMLIDDSRGTQWAKKFQGKYSSTTGILRQLKKHGFENVVDALNSRMVEIGKLNALPGDIGVCLMDDGFDHICWCSGQKWFGFVQDGRVEVNTNQIHAAFDLASFS